MIVVRWR